MSKLTQRDAFWNRIFELAKKDHDIVVVSEDMGAPALDQFRVELPDQFVNVGIAEQNGLLVGAGMALEGKKPFIYAIAPFVTLRALELIRVECGIMDIPVTLVGVGAGFGYEDSGPTHHLVEDIAIMRSMPHIAINNVADAEMARAVADYCATAKHTNYVRLERKLTENVYSVPPDIEKGFTVFQEGADGVLVASGFMLQPAQEILAGLKARGKDFGLIDLFRIPANEAELVKVLSGAKKIVSFEEHFLPGGFGSYLLETMNDAGCNRNILRLGVEHAQGYNYVYGGRKEIHKSIGLDVPTVVERILG